MGIFTRVRDIISSNLNALCDKAEDPEKMIKLIIREMEDTLVEIKASCAGAMASKKKAQRDVGLAQTRRNEWAGKAQLAVNKGREDLAREALLEKRRYSERVETLEKELSHCDEMIQQYQQDIVQLEDKLTSAREKQRLLVQRHIHAQRKKKAQEDIRRADTAEAMVRYEDFESRIDRMESEADLVNYGRKSGLDDEFARLDQDEDLEKELAALKAKRTSGSQG